MKINIFNHLKKAFPLISERPSLDLPAINLPLSDLLTLSEYIQESLSFDMLVDVTAIDWDQQSPRFTVVYHFLSSLKKNYLRVAVDCGSDQNPSIPSLTCHWPAADWHEREVYDMFGIQFEGHPDLKRILMWEGYEYFPLRKEFPLAGIEGELPAEDVAKETKAKVLPAPLAGGPFCSTSGGPMSQREPRGLDQSWSESNNKPS